MLWAEWIAVIVLKNINIFLYLKYYIKNSSCQSNLDYTLAKLCLPQQIKADSLKFKTEKASIQKNFKERISHCNLGLLSQTLKSIKLISQRRQQNRRRRLSVKVGWSESSKCLKISPFTIPFFYFLKCTLMWIISCPGDLY